MTDRVSQSEKKDLGVRESRGEICAFIDDDAFPSRDWLTRAVAEFNDPQTGIVCGPGVTPDNDSFMQQAGGVVYSSLAGSGPYRFRYIPTKRMNVTEFAGYNFLIKREFYLSIGGIGTVFRSGDDTILSQKTLQRGKSIVYNPSVLVYHHRRALFKAHLNQIKTYALHRGYFLKSKKEPSAGLVYLLPLVVAAVAMTFALSSAYVPELGIMILVLFAAYLLFCLISALSVAKNMKAAIAATAGIVLTHAYYVCYLVRGMLLPALNERPSY